MVILLIIVVIIIIRILIVIIIRIIISIIIYIIIRIITIIIIRRQNYSFISGAAAFAVVIALIVLNLFSNGHSSIAMIIMNTLTDREEHIET